MKADSLGMLPIYIGVKGEEKQGLATGSENYWCINSKASDADKKATKDFLKWVVTSKTGIKSLSSDMGFTTRSSPSATSSPTIRWCRPLLKIRTPARPQSLGTSP